MSGLSLIPPVRHNPKTEPKTDVDVSVTTSLALMFPSEIMIKSHLLAHLLATLIQTQSRFSLQPIFKDSLFTRFSLSIESQVPLQCWVWSFHHPSSYPNNNPGTHPRCLRSCYTCLVASSIGHYSPKITLADPKTPSKNFWQKISWPPTQFYGYLCKLQTDYCGLGKISLIKYTVSSRTHRNTHLKCL